MTSGAMKTRNVPSDVPRRIFEGQSQPPWRLSPEFLWVCAGLVLLTAFRLWYCTQLELVGDEAYYWVQSRHYGMCYFDKGPAVSWTIALGRALFGDTVFGVRFFAVLLSAATSLWLFILARTLFSDRVALIAVVIATVVPMLAVGSILMTIDPLSMFFWTVAACAFWRAKDSRNAGWWLLAGLLVGLGMLAKYTNAAELLSFALFCAFWAPCRVQLVRPGFYLMLLAAGVATLPCWIWNAEHGWVTMRHLAERGDLVEAWKARPVELAKFLGGQAGVISPLIFLGVLAAVFLPAADQSGAPQRRFLLCLFLPLFAGYSILSLNHAAQPNWTAPCYIAGLILLAARWPQWRLSRPRFRWLGAAALGIALIETIALHQTAWLHLPPRKDPLDRARGWRDLAAQVAQTQTREGAQFVIAHTYMTASLLSFYLPGRPFVFLPPTPVVSNQFSIWPGYESSAPGCVALYVSEFATAPKSLRSGFAQVREIGQITPREAGRTLLCYHVFLCSNPP